MKRVSHKALSILTAAFMILALSVISPQTASANDGGSQGQNSADQADTNNGGWDNTTVGVAGRPFVTDLKVDGMSMLSGTPTSPTDNLWSSQIRAVVYAFNSCRTGVAPAPGVCYANPNRIGITVGYGTQSTINTNWASTNAQGFGITENSVIDVTVKLNALASSLGWTWLNGTPTYWAVDANAGTVHLKFKPSYMPDSSGIDNQCTTIPVSTCSTNQAQSEMLVTSMVVSVDNTNSFFAGTLFATSNAIMGSLELAGTFSAASPTTNALTYGLSAPHLFASDYTAPGSSAAGDVRKGKLYGLLSNSLLSTGFGVTDVSQVASLLTIARASGTTASGTDAVTWSAWTAAENGTDGQLVTISDITFSAPKFEMKRKSESQATTNTNNTSAPTTNNSPTTLKLRKGSKATQSKLLTDSGFKLNKGQKLKLRVAKGSARICSVSGTSVRTIKKGSCVVTVTVVKSNGKAVAGKTKTLTYRVS